MHRLKVATSSEQARDQTTGWPGTCSAVMRLHALQLRVDIGRMNTRAFASSDDEESSIDTIFNYAFKPVDPAENIVSCRPGASLRRVDKDGVFAKRPSRNSVGTGQGKCLPAHRRHKAAEQRQFGGRNSCRLKNGPESWAHAFTYRICGQKRVPIGHVDILRLSTERKSTQARRRRTKQPCRLIV